MLVAGIPWSETARRVAVFAGRLSPEKGAAEAIEIAGRAGIHLIVHGDRYDEEYAARFIDPWRGRPGVEIRTAVPRRQLWEVMSSASVVLCPARWDEPFGMVAAEAQAAGTPVVGFRRGGLEEVVIHGRTGYLVEPDDVEAAAAAVAKAARLSRRACREHAVHDLDISASVDAHEELYRQVSARPAAASRA